MFRLIGTFILLLLLLFGGVVWLLDTTPDTPAPEREAQQKSKPEAAAKSEADELREALQPHAPSSGGAPSFDIARIDPKGTSVFAGRAEPGSLVTITIDGKEIGTAKVDDNGEWTLSTDARINNPDGKLALFKAPPGAVARVVGAETPPPRHAAEESPAAAAARPKSASSVASGMLKSLEGMVAAARTEKEQPATPAAAVPPPPPATGAPAPAPAGAEQPSPPSQSISVPVPITFVFNEATLTGDGKKAATLLLEYLQLKRFPKITLTGHADERGSDELNMILSRERLDTVASFLREGGYDGQLDLIPKGKSEPYTGVVRGDFSQEDLWQLDRRVELLVTR